MLRLNFRKDHNSPYKLLCLGAHSDDIEIGCGGTILKLLKNNRKTEAYWVVFGAIGQRAHEARKSANLFLAEARAKKVIVNRFKDGFFPFVGAEIKEYFESLKKQFCPDLIFTHHRSDLHQDHRLISDLTWNTFRDHLILEYEIPKYDGDLGYPNIFVHLSEKTCRKKIENIFDCFKTQQANHWFTEDTFLSILRIRGLESNAPEKFAEGFHCRKIIF